MNSRQRFQQTMRYGAPDRVPYFEEGLRDDVLERWHKQGLPAPPRQRCLGLAGVAPGMGLPYPADRIVRERRPRSRLGRHTARYRDELFLGTEMRS